MAKRKCQQCGKQVEGTSTLISHLVEEHNLNQDEVLVQYPLPGLYCQICGETLDMGKSEFVKHLQNEHELKDENIQLNLQSNPVHGEENQIPPVIRENFDRVMTYIEDITEQYDSRTNKKLWIRAALIGSVVVGVFFISWHGILGNQTITSLVSVIVGYLLAREAI